MFVPLHDNTPLQVIRFQYVTVALIAANLVVFLTTGAFTGEDVLTAVATGYGLVPGELTGLVPPPAGWEPVPEPLTLITYQFLHAGWWHLASNMLFLWVFADNIEDAFGSLAFLLFYLFCGIAGGLAHVLVSPASDMPLVGASGAVSGVLGAYAILFPKARVWILLFMRLPLRIGAAWVLGGWFLLQVASLFMAAGNDVQVAFWAHIGGFVAGAAVTWVLRRRLYLAMGR